MLGAIIGDVIGSAYEFHNTKDYHFTLFLSDSALTDDSVMTMAVAYWLLKDKALSYQGLEDSMVMFGKKYPSPMGGYGGGFHTWLFSPEGLSSFDDQYGKAPYESKTCRHPYGSWGNGSAMRVSAVGWFFDTLEETERIAAISAAITHNLLFICLLLRDGPVFRPFHIYIPGFSQILSFHSKIFFLRKKFRAHFHNSQHTEQI